MTGTYRAYIGIGSNRGSRIRHCETAIQKINQHPSMSVIKRSSWIETHPVGYTRQRNFINGAIEINTSLTPFDLLEALLDIEKQMGRKRTFKWGPRVIDLDILLYADRILKTERLTLPHPELKKRDFVKIPLLELNSDLRTYFI